MIKIWLLVLSIMTPDGDVHAEIVDVLHNAGDCMAEMEKHMTAPNVVALQCELHHASR